MPAPWPSSGFSPNAFSATSGLDSAAAREFAEVFAGLGGDAEVGARETVPGLATDGDPEDDDDDQGGDADAA